MNGVTGIWEGEHKCWAQRLWLNRVENAMSDAPSTVGNVVVPAEHDSEVNVGKWDRWYKLPHFSRRGTMYGDATTYYMAAAFLTGCAAVEDWGCGAGGFQRFCPGEYIGVDGSGTPSKVAELTTYRSDIEGILLRHVLEHNYNWPKILEAAVKSFRKKLCLVLFTPFADTTREIAHNRGKGIDVPDLALAPSDIEAHFAGLSWKLFAGIETRSQYGVEHMYCVWRESR